MISIVMSYHNRYDLFQYTLSTISESDYSGSFELILVDDFSDDGVDELVDKFSNLNIRYFKMSDIYEERWYTNPSIPYNVGFSKIRGDKVIIQNPECCHIGDVLSHTEKNLTKDNYLSYHCWASTKAHLPLLWDSETRNQVLNLKPSSVQWYNHRVRRPKAFHFANAIHIDNLKRLNGFDERFAKGTSFDDTEFVFRVNQMDLKIDFVEAPYVIHQWHPTSPSLASGVPNNRKLYDKIVAEYNGDPMVNPDKKTVGE